MSDRLPFSIVDHVICDQHIAYKILSRRVSDRCRNDRFAHMDKICPVIILTCPSP